MVETVQTLPPEVAETSPPLPRTPLAEICRPHAKILHLSDGGERIAVDDQLVISFRYLVAPHRETELDEIVGPTENLIIAKRRGLYVVFPRSSREMYNPPPIGNPDEINAMFVTMKPRRHMFYVGERYELGFLPEDDRQPGDPIDVLISSEQPVALTVLLPHERDRAFLARTQAA